MDKKLKIYRMNEVDTVVAHTKKQAIDWYMDYMGDYSDEIKEDCIQEKDLSKGYWFNLPHEKFLDKVMNLQPGKELRVANWAGDPAYWITFQDALDNHLNEIDVPGIICTTEY